MQVAVCCVRAASVKLKQQSQRVGSGILAIIPQQRVILSQVRVV
jgi:hypothetical protein